ncbi:MAG: type I restriction endonuclease subunit R, partial [Candidatus Odinarchaeia archaeon]
KDIDLDRESKEEPLLVSVLAESIRKINSKLNLTPNDVKLVINKLRSKTTGAEGIRGVLRFMKNGVPIKLEKTKELRYIDLFDYKNVENNWFIVSNQVIFRNKETIIPDIVLFVNGIPLVLVECKDPTNPSVSWEDGFNQIKSYEQLMPELFKYVQFSVAAEENVRYFANIPWEYYPKTHTWREEGLDERDSIIEMLSPHKLLDIIRNYVFIREKRGRVIKVITRYMQYRAANKIYSRVIDTLNGKDDKKSGLIWHWQGTGKTLTMIFAAHKLYREKILEKPTILFILDRIELKDQIYDELNFLDLGFKPEEIESIEQLKRFLKHDEGKGKRGIFVILIYKFRKEELDELQKYLHDKTKSGEITVLNRENIIGFIDEGHRTQYGVLAAQMRRIFKNAFFFAFTGTPIAKKSKDTYLLFSYPEKGEEYLDKYFIEDSIRDGFTIPIACMSRLDDQHLKKADLEAFLAQELEEIPEEFREDVKEKVKKKLRGVRVLMSNPKRIEKIAKDIANHFKENVDGRFKAMVVAVSRSACVKYKKALDKYLPEEYTDVIMTYNRSDPPPITKYFSELKNKYNKIDEDEIREEIIDKFKKEGEYPKILIVTDMLLTGFDAPILQTMYLDKPLKEHRLLQAIARTNRPYPEKEAGLIVDYVGIMKKLSQALKIYSTKDIGHVVWDLSELET